MIPSIGSLEEIVLLLVMINQGNAYGVGIAEAYHEHTGRKITIPAVHTVLKRLEKKGYVVSKMGGATAERGGRRKRLFEVTASGHQLLLDLQDTRAKLWSMAPKLSFN